MRFNLHTAVLTGLSVLLAWPAAAWGPGTQDTLVTTSVHLYSKAQNIALNKREKEFREGTKLSMDALKEMYPAMAVNAVTGIESEMALLQSVRGQVIDAYFAYRLGALGKLICEVTAPMADGNAKYQKLYYADVDRNISGKINITPSKLTTIEPRVYFPERAAEARVNDDLIAEDYKSGQGYAGVAQSLIAHDASRTLDAITNAWHTILAGPPLRANISETQKRAYVLSASQFYADRGNDREIDDAAERLAKIVPQTPDMHVKIGDMLYGAGFFERAVKRYQTVLRLDPSRRDVVEKISEFYMKKANDALETESFEKALEAYGQALAANPLHPTAEAERLRVQRLIKERDERLAMNQAHLARAEGFVQMAERDSMRNLYAEAIASLHQAIASYGEVTQEFPLEHHKAERGLQETRVKIEKHKESLIINAQDFGGSGFALDAQALAGNGAAKLDEEALRALLNSAYRKELNGLESGLQEALRLTKPEK